MRGHSSHTKEDQEGDDGDRGWAWGDGHTYTLPGEGKVTRPSGSPENTSNFKVYEYLCSSNSTLRLWPTDTLTTRWQGQRPIHVEDPEPCLYHHKIKSMAGLVKQKASTVHSVHTVRFRFTHPGTYS